jgi:hypothetical protein
MGIIANLKQDIQKDSQSKPVLQEPTKQQQVERLQQPELDKVLKLRPPIIETDSGLIFMTNEDYAEIDSKPSPVKQVLSTILNCAKDASQTIYSLDIDSFEDDMLVIRADIFLELLQQEIEKLDE